MSYDYPDDYVPPPPKKRTLRDRCESVYWRLVIWCRLDSRIGILERWADRVMTRNGIPRKPG